MFSWRRKHYLVSAVPATSLDELIAGPGFARRRIGPGWLIVLAGLVTAALLLFSDLLISQPVHSEQETTPPPVLVSDRQISAPVSVTVVTARRDIFMSSMTVSGSLVAREEVVVGSEIEGAAIREILVEEGDHVTEGQTLAVLSSDVAQAMLVMNTAQIERAGAMIEQADSAIEEAEISFVLATNAHDRARPLLKSGVASPDAIEQRQASARMASARLKSARHARSLAVAEQSLARAQREEISMRLKWSTIKAPADGIVMQRSAQLGAIVSSDGAPLFRLIKDGSIELDALVPMAELGRLQQDLPAEIVVTGSSDPLNGRIRLISTRIDASSRMGNVRIALGAAGPQRIGAFARARVMLSQPSSVVLPLSAVLWGVDGPYVQVVRNGKVETRLVALGDNASGNVQIMGGIAEGEQVVATAGHWLHAGDQVAPATAAEVIALKD